MRSFHFRRAVWGAMLARRVPGLIKLRHGVIIKPIRPACSAHSVCGPRVTAVAARASSASPGAVGGHPGNPELHADIRLMGGVLGETISAVHGGPSLARVETVRRAAKAWRKARAAGDETVAAARLAELAGTLRKLSGEEMLLVARGFAHFLSLANVAEQNHRVRAVKRRRAASRPRFEDFATSVTRIAGDDEAVRRMETISGVGDTQPLRRGDLDDVIDALSRQVVELVLTAHPTEVNRRSLLMKHHELQNLLSLLSPPTFAEAEAMLASNERPVVVDAAGAVARDAAASSGVGRHLPTYQRAELIRQVRRLVAELWGTDELRREKPTPQDEARSGIYVVEKSLWDAVPSVMRRVDHALATIAHGTEVADGGRASRPLLPLDAAILRFGSWMGGDRDGNPNVTGDVTREVSLLGRWMALHLIGRDLARLRLQLSMSHGPPAMTKYAAALAEGESVARAEELAFGGSITSAVSEKATDTGVREPYRAVLRAILDRVETTKRHVEASLAKFDSEHLDAPGTRPELPEGPSPTSNALVWEKEDVLRPLLRIYDCLEGSNNTAIANGPLLDTIRRVSTFGVTLTRLDLREDSVRHTQALDAVTRQLGLGGYAEWDEATKVAFLEHELGSKRPLIPRGFSKGSSVPPEVLRTLDTFAAIKDCGPDAFSCYIISMAQYPSDVLAVYLLQREAGVGDGDDASPPLLPVVPLFETLADLERSSDTVGRLLASPVARSLIGNELQVMIGYSDSGKDAGRLAAAWSLYKAQERLVQTCKAAGVKLTLFHGKGGSVSRGGGTAGRGHFRSILAQPAGSVEGRFRSTEQGEMINLQFGSTQLAEATLETYTSAVLAETFRDPTAPQHTPRPEWRELLDEMSEMSCEAYRGIVREHESFIKYFRHATPEPELATMNIGSRPARRQRAGGGVETLRAIPWVFAWTQTRLILTAWLGIGEALSAKLEDPVAREHLIEMYRLFPWWREFIESVEVSLAKADAVIAEHYDTTLLAEVDTEQREALAALGAELRRKLQVTVEAVLTVSGHTELAEGNTILQSSLVARNAYVDPLNVIQADVMAKLRRAEADGTEPTPALRDLMRLTIGGIAAGLKNTG